MSDVFFPVLYIIISFALAIFSGLLPNYFLGSYLFVHGFLLMKGENVNILGVELSAFRTFLITFCVIFIARHFRLIKDNLLVYQRKHFLLLLGLILSIALPTLSHFLFWDIIPRAYLIGGIKSLFPMILIFYPLQKWEIKKILKGTAISCFLFLLINGYSSYIYFYTIKKGFLRIRDFTPTELTFTHFFTLNNKVIPILHLTESSLVLWCVFSVPLFYTLIELFNKSKLEKAIGIMAISFSTYVIYLNQTLKLFISEIISTIAIFISMKFSKSNRSSFNSVVIYFLGLIVASFFIYTFFYDRTLIAKIFIMEEIDLNKSINFHTYRSQTFAYSWIKLWTLSPLKGFGASISGLDDEILPFGNLARQATGHMEGLDMMFYYGIPFGLIASFVYIVPLIYSLFKIRKWVKHSASFGVQFIAISFLIFCYRFYGELGRGVESHVLIVYYLLFIIVYDLKIDKKIEEKGL